MSLTVNYLLKQNWFLPDNLSIFVTKLKTKHLIVNLRYQTEYEKFNRNQRRCKKVW